MAYSGGRLSIRALLDLYPGFVLQEIPLESPGAGRAVRQSGFAFLSVHPGSLTQQRIQAAEAIGGAILHLDHLRGWALPVIPKTEEERAIQRKTFATELLAPLWAVERAIPGRVPTDRKLVISKLQIGFAITAIMAAERLAGLLAALAT